MLAIAEAVYELMQGFDDGTPSHVAQAARRRPARLARHP